MFDAVSSYSVCIIWFDVPQICAMLTVDEERQYDYPRPVDGDMFIESGTVFIVHILYICMCVCV